VRGIVLNPDVDSTQALQLLFDFMQQWAETCLLSSWHCLFPLAQQAEQLQALGLRLREGVQFQWFNRNYQSF